MADDTFASPKNLQFPDWQRAARLPRSTRRCSAIPFRDRPACMSRPHGVIVHVVKKMLEFAGARAGAVCAAPCNAMTSKKRA
jgi:hypothetical protein